MLQQWLSTLADYAQQIQPHLVSIVKAALLLLVGIFICRYLGYWAQRAAQAAVDKTSGPVAGPRAAAAHKLTQSVPNLVGRFAFWFAILPFVAGAIELLGLPVATRAAEQITSYMPGAFTALAIVFVGFVVASLAGGLTAATFGARTAYAGAVGRGVQVLLIVLAVLVGLEQVGVHGDLIIVLLSVVLGVVLSGAALAFGLGARTAVSNIVASYYVAQTYRVGQTIKVGEYEGRIVRTTPTSVVLDTKGGQVMIPSRIFTEQPSMLITEIH